MEKGRKLILIIDTDIERAEQIKTLVRQVNRSCEIRITNDYAEAYSLILRYEVVFVFLDLEPEQAASAAVKFIDNLRKNEQYQLLPVVGMAKTEMLRKKAYAKWNCVKYLMPPIDEEMVRELLIRILAKEAEQNENSMFLVRKDNVRYVIHIKDFIYAESFDRNLHIYVQNEPIIFIAQKSIEYILELANSKCLLRCSRGTLVNCMHIDTVDIDKRQIILKNGIELKIGGCYIDEIREWQTAWR